MTEDLKAVQEEMVALENDPAKMAEMMSDPEKKEAFVNRMKKAFPDQADQMDQMMTELESIVNHDESHPAVQQVKQLSEVKAQNEQQIDAFRQRVETESQEIVQTVNSQRIKQLAMLGASALATGALTYFLAPALGPVLKTLAVGGATAAGGIAGAVASDAIWVKPIREKAKLRSQEWQKEGSELAAKEQEIEQSIAQAGNDFAKKFTEQAAPEQAAPEQAAPEQAAPEQAAPEQAADKSFVERNARQHAPEQNFVEQYAAQDNSEPDIPQR